MTAEIYIQLLAKSYFIAFTIMLVLHFIAVLLETNKDLVDLARIKAVEKGRSPIGVSANELISGTLYVLSMYLK